MAGGIMMLTPPTFLLGLSMTVGGGIASLNVGVFESVFTEEK